MGLGYPRQVAPPGWKERLNIEGRWSQTGNRLVRQCAVATAVKSVATARLEGGSDCRGE